MPTNPGVPMPFVPGAIQNPYDWIDVGGPALGAQQSALMRGHPVPMSYWQMRTVRGPATAPQPVPYYVHSRPYSRGADAYAPQFGQLSYNPIGAGIYGGYKLPVIAGPGARYQNSAIWFDTQTIPTSIHMGPSMPIEVINALIATSHVGPSYKTTG